MITGSFSAPPSFDKLRSSQSRPVFPAAFCFPAPR
jgi:hypothetical protein